MPRYIEPLPLLTIAIVGAGIIALLSMLFEGKGKDNQIQRGDILKVIFAGILIALIRKGMLILGLSFTSPIDGSIIMTLSPIMVLIISVIVGLERFSARKSIGILFGFGGAVGVIVTGIAHSADNSGLLGNLLVLGCALISAIYVVWFKRLLQHYDPIVVMRWMFIVAAAIILPIGAKAVVEVEYSNFDTGAWLAILYLGVIPTFAPNLLLSWAIKRVAPTTASIYTYLQPVVAVSISIIIGVAKLHYTTVISALLIFMGVALVIYKSPNSIK